jgi:putative serine protease PepD
MTTDERPGLNTPPFGPGNQRPDFPSDRPIGNFMSKGGDPLGPPRGSAASYTAADFPAPAGVPIVTEVPQATTAVPRRRRGFGTVIATAALAAVVGAGAGVGSYVTLVAGAGPAAAPINVSTLPATQSPRLDGTVAAAAAKIEPSVVTISVQSDRGSGVGSGVVVDADGHILTNNHVVAGAAQGGITVTFSDGTTAAATIVGTSPGNDLAVIKVSGVANLVPATFAESRSLQVGQTVVAAGAPLGLTESVTSGIVSNTARPVRSGSDAGAVYLAVQTDAAINPGNSGGPLVDLNGAVVGINSSIATTGSESGNIGIGFAVPSDLAVRVASEIIATGRSADSALGVTLAGSDSASAASTGVTLQTVTEGGAAAAAGLRAGDVVTKINDFETTSSDGLVAAIRFYPPGTEVTVTYLRNGGSPQTLAVTLGSK